MRRLLAPVLATGLIAAPAIALAAETTTEDKPKTPAKEHVAVTTGDLTEQGQRQLREARAQLRREKRAERRRRAERRAERLGVPVAAVEGGDSTASPQLEAIAACESGGNPRAVGGGGQFRGKYQFTYSTWASVGGSGDPAAASEAEQDMRAARLLSTGGAGHWPVCGG